MKNSKAFTTIDGVYFEFKKRLIMKIGIFGAEEQEVKLLKKQQRP